MMGRAWQTYATLWPLARELGKGKRASQAADPLIKKDQDTVTDIRNKTKESNGDNLDRTSAYLAFFRLSIPKFIGHFWRISFRAMPDGA